MSLIKLSINGISYSQTQTGAYALILSEIKGTRKLPIIIAKAEAQSIAIALEENINPPRPLTHDLIKSISDKFELKLKEVIIHKLIDGVFHSSLVLERDDQEAVIDSRTSDAVALAIRFKAPIYTYQNILDQAGLELNMDQEPQREVETQETEDYPEIKENLGPKSELSAISDSDLEKMLEKSLEMEDYEKAALIRDELEKRKS
jgi:bifunctional DNase/RNase